MRPLEIFVPPLKWLQGLCPNTGVPPVTLFGAKKRRNCCSAVGGEFGGSSS